MDARNCQTSTVAPAEPGVFPFVITPLSSHEETVLHSITRAACVSNSGLEAFYGPKNG
jgi:hypothetical protein